MSGNIDTAEVHICMFHVWYVGCNETDLTKRGGTVNTTACADRGFVNSSSISGGVVCYNGTTAGSMAVYICDDFLLMEGDEVTRVCQKDGIWNGSIPQCNSKAGTLLDS